MKRYIVGKGKHRSRWWPRLLFGKVKMSYQITFEKNCWYYEGEDTYPSGVNKLVGFSRGIHLDKVPKWLRKYSNAYRIGYKCDDAGQMFLYEYICNRGEEYRRLIPEINLSQWDPTIIVSFTEKDGEIIIEVFHMNSHKGTTLSRISNYWKGKYLPPKFWFKVGYMLYFYFGGLAVAPWKMTTLWKKI